MGRQKDFEDWAVVNEDDNRASRAVKLAFGHLPFEKALPYSEVVRTKHEEIYMIQNEPGMHDVQELKEISEDIISGVLAKGADPKLVNRAIKLGTRLGETKKLNWF